MNSSASGWACSRSIRWGRVRDYVLRSDRARAEREIAAQMVVDAAEAVELILTEGVDKAMSRFQSPRFPLFGRKFARIYSCF